MTYDNIVRFWRMPTQQYVPVRPVVRGAITQNSQIKPVSSTFLSLRSGQIVELDTSSHLVMWKNQRIRTRVCYFVL
ncbi:uncharacterized protein PHALS_11192 [Plasmopara halstedii]|uniref:Uncharacterized protein n=1 Tax=Plasmopara halstedii TaxID=4781 RepID=A0A0P1AJI5_PLAHL|nr:uncharacterized protein PHALS_11192 [Plasmopara halstedii]CEG41022.1 hypothetical protein PHALS_11192 [Plasmopara halstedii]|eukprot:XP_024577391.1 hypothetical protein PHALS_11192 [Plasmopara halstedii]